MPDTSASKKNIDKIIELLPEFYNEAGGRIDLLTDIFESQFSELRKVQTQFLEIGIRDACFDKALIENDLIVEHLQLLDKHGHIKALAEINEKNEINNKKSKNANKAKINTEKRRQKDLLQFVTENSHWEGKGKKLSQKECAPIKRNFLKSFPEYDTCKNSPNLIIKDLVKLGIKEPKKKTASK